MDPYYWRFPQKNIAEKYATPGYFNQDPVPKPGSAWVDMQNALAPQPGDDQYVPGVLSPKGKPMLSAGSISLDPAPATPTTPVTAPKKKNPKAAPTIKGPGLTQTPATPSTPAAPTAPGPNPSTSEADGDYYTPDDTQFQELLAKMDPNQLQGLQDVKHGIGGLEDKYKELLAKEPGVDLSPLFAYSDAQTGHNLTKSYRPPASQEDLDAQALALQQAIQKEKSGYSDKEIEALNHQLQASGHIFGLQSSGLDRLEQAKLTAAALGLRNQENNRVKESIADKNNATRVQIKGMGGIHTGNAQADRKVSKDVHDMTPELASSRSDIGRNQTVITNAKRVLTASDQFTGQDDDADKRQMREVAAATAAMIGAGNIQSQHAVDEFVPNTLRGNVAAWQEWLTNTPHGTQQQAFLKRMVETSEREGHQADQNIKHFQLKYLRQPFYRQHPDLQQQMIDSFDFKPEEIDPNGNYILKPFQPGQFKNNSIAPAKPFAGTPAAATGMEALIQRAKEEKAKRAAGSK